VSVAIDKGKTAEVPPGRLGTESAPRRLGAIPVVGARGDSSALAEVSERSHSTPDYQAGDLARELEPIPSTRTVSLVSTPNARASFSSEVAK
jgi:hypothetical protein